MALCTTAFKKYVFYLLEVKWQFYTQNPYKNVFFVTLEKKGELSWCNIIISSKTELVGIIMAIIKII